MTDVLLADTCICGSALWHKLVHPNVLWCRKCGSVRPIFASRWMVPLDRAGELPHSDPADPPFTSEQPTDPGTPVAKGTLVPSKGT